MKYLSGASGSPETAKTLADAGVGLMVQVGNSLHRRIAWFPFWAADIGMAYNADEQRYFDYLDRLPRTPLFVVSPDAYPDPVESQRRGLEHAPMLRSLGFRVAVVAQSDSERLTWPWEDFDCLFIGGTRLARGKDEWKESEAAAGLAKAARNHGLQVHMGRVNSMRRLFRARQMGCTSCDGTFVKHGGDFNAMRLDRMLRNVNAKQPLPIFERFESVSNG